jgi:hypothetical protein
VSVQDTFSMLAGIIGAKKTPGYNTKRLVRYALDRRLLLDT